MRKLKEINKAMTSHFLREHDILKCWTGDRLTKNDNNDLIKEMDSIRKRGNGVALLLIETK